MNWYKTLFKLIFAAGFRSEIVRGPDNVDYFCVFGDTFNIKDQLKGLGFYFNGDRYCWYVPLQTIRGNMQLQTSVRGLGIPINFTGAPAAQPRPQPQAPAAKPSGGTWFLATSVPDGQPLALSRSPQGWTVMQESGESTVVPETQVQSVAKSVRDASGNPISATDPQTLFEKFRQMNPAQPQPQQAKNAPGRIPEDRISPHQQQIRGSFLETEKSIMINALAGTGKTTMLRDLASFKNPNERWLYLVFNKKNQVEASSGKSKFPNNVEVLTSHSFLGKVLGKSVDLGSIPHTDLWNQRGERINAILDEMMEQDQTFPGSFRFAAKKVIKQIASMSKACAINPADQDAMAKVAAVVDQYGIDTDLSTEKVRSDQNFKPELIDKALDLLHYCMPGNSLGQQFDGFRDHDDTLWYAAINGNLNWPKYDVVLADEVQDFNTCQTIMLQKLAQAGARIVAVGDPNQAIYMFRGADSNAFANVQNVLQTAPTGNAPHELPVNYRSGRKIIEYVNQNTKVKNLVAGKNYDGVVTEGTPYDQMMAGLTNEARQGGGKTKEQTAFIARTNAPLVDGALDLMRSNIDFVIIGRDFSKELIEQVEKVTGKGRNAKVIPINQLADSLAAHVSALEQKWVGKISKADQLKDMKAVTEALTNVIDFLAMSNFYDQKVKMQVNDSNRFTQYLAARFGGVNIDNAEEAEKLNQRDPKSYVTLTSAHRSKGLEFDRVYILKPNLFPHPKAKRPAEIDQEENAKYVAMTRAMKELHILQPEEQQKKQQRG